MLYCENCEKFKIKYLERQIGIMLFLICPSCWGLLTDTTRKEIARELKEKLAEVA